MAKMGAAYRALVGKREERRPLGRPRLNGRIILKWILVKLDGRAWTGSIWLRIGTGGWLLCIRLWTFEFHKMRGISWVAEDVSASQEGLCSMELSSLIVVLKEVNCGTLPCVRILFSTYELISVVPICNTAYRKLDVSIFGSEGGKMITFRTAHLSAASQGVQRDRKHWTSKCQPDLWPGTALRLGYRPLPLESRSSIQWLPSLWTIKKQLFGKRFAVNTDVKQAVTSRRQSN